MAARRAVQPSRRAGSRRGTPRHTNESTKPRSRSASPVSRGGNHRRRPVGEIVSPQSSSRLLVIGRQIGRLPVGRCPGDRRIVLAIPARPGAEVVRTLARQESVEILQRRSVIDPNRPWRGPIRYAAHPTEKSVSVSPMWCLPTELHESPTGVAGTRIDWAVSNFVSTCLAVFFAATALRFLATALRSTATGWTERNGPPSAPPSRSSLCLPATVALRCAFFSARRCSSSSRRALLHDAFELRLDRLSPLRVCFPIGLEIRVGFSFASLGNRIQLGRLAQLRDLSAFESAFVGQLRVADQCTDHLLHPGLEGPESERRRPFVVGITTVESRLRQRDRQPAVFNQVRTTVWVIVMSRFPSIRRSWRVQSRAVARARSASASRAAASWRRDSLAKRGRFVAARPRRLRFRGLLHGGLRVRRARDRCGLSSARARVRVALQRRRGFLGRELPSLSFQSRSRATTSASVSACSASARDAQLPLRRRPSPGAARLRGSARRRRGGCRRPL